MNQCDALTKRGKRCSRSSTWTIPCVAVYDARVTSYRADKFRSVHLCSCHAGAEWRLRRSNRRLPLHHRGFLGAFNRHEYGNMVLTVARVDWDRVKRLTVPKYWKGGAS